MATKPNAVIARHLVPILCAWILNLDRINKALSRHSDTSAKNAKTLKDKRLPNT